MLHAGKIAAAGRAEDVLTDENLKKVYKLYDRRSDRLKETFGLAKNKHKDHYALNGINMEIRQGETVGIIGTNGSGKSTILKIITGVLNPTEGKVTTNGRISALLELGAGFNMEYNGIENVYLNGTMMGFSDKEIEERLPKILEFADISTWTSRPITVSNFIVPHLLRFSLQEKAVHSRSTLCR